MDTSKAVEIIESSLVKKIVAADGTVIMETTKLVKLEDMDQIKDKVPYYNPEEENDTTAFVKLIGTNLPWEWYLTNYEGDGIFSGLVNGFAVESGTVYFDDLIAAGCYIDPSFKEEKVAVLFKALNR